jgi:hypothetical protein
MAESTAGIGEAGALVNRAKAPATMDITRGIQMAESNALKKAQLEAAKEAKKQAKMAAMDKYRTIKTGLYKDPSVNEEAKRLGRELGYEMEAAVNSGDINKVSRLNQDLEFLKGDLKIKDTLSITYDGTDIKFYQNNTPYLDIYTNLLIHTLKSVHLNHMFLSNN